MGLQRLVCAALEFHSCRVRLDHVWHQVRVETTRHAPMSLRTWLSRCPQTGLSKCPQTGLCTSSSMWPRLFTTMSPRTWLSTRPPTGLFWSMSPRAGLSGRAVQPGRGLSSSARPSRDISLFEHDRTRFFRLLALFCGGQLLFWTHMAHFAFTELRNTEGAAPAAATTTTGLAGMWSFEMNLGSSSWRYGFTLGCLSIAAAIVGLGALFCRRSVNRVVLHEGGKVVSIYTQSPLGPGRGQKITVPLSEVSCHAHRQESPSFIPLKVKGHKFYFLLDKEGNLNNGRLFDITVGAYRSL